jgi:hypothetical protein
MELGNICNIGSGCNFNMAMKTFIIVLLALLYLLKDGKSDHGHNINIP